MGALDKSQTRLQVYVTEKRGAMITSLNEVTGLDLFRVFRENTGQSSETDLNRASAFVRRERSWRRTGTSCQKQQGAWPTDHAEGGSRNKQTNKQSRAFSKIGTITCTTFCNCHGSYSSIKDTVETEKQFLRKVEKMQIFLKMLCCNSQNFYEL